MQQLLGSTNRSLESSWALSGLRTNQQCLQNQRPLLSKLGDLAFPQFPLQHLASSPSTEGQNSRDCPCPRTPLFCKDGALGAALGGARAWGWAPSQKPLHDLQRHPRPGHCSRLTATSGRGFLSGAGGPEVFQPRAASPKRQGHSADFHRPRGQLGRLGPFGAQTSSF